LLDRWSGPLAGAGTTLVVAIPAMVIAEDWNGRPMIDEGGAWWLIPAAFALLGFFAGGVVAARGRRNTARALAAGLVVGVAATVVLVAADGMRRVLVNPTLSAGVVYLWLEAAAAAIGVTMLGALCAVFLGVGAPAGPPRATVDDDRPDMDPLVDGERTLPTR